MPPTKPDPDLILGPDPDAPGLSRSIVGVDHLGQPQSVNVIEERPLTIFLNAREIVTAMTIGDYPEYLALGFLRNQGMLTDRDEITAVDYDDEIDTVVVRTRTETDHEAKLARKTRTSGCAVGTVFGDMIEGIEGLRLPAAQVRTSWLYELSARINRMPSLYLSAGAIHGTVLCQGAAPLVYMEDVGRHNAVDKISGWMLRHRAAPEDKILYTTGRLTSEMVIKTALMGIPVLVSRSGFTAWGVDIARQVGLTLVGRLRGQRYICLAGADRLIHDSTPPEGQADDRPRTGRAAE
ncbi:MAG: formate dehydrogenase accessory sulfurtransferase FdhD [Rhodobacteraceae bacterium]|nr:formate dehydrogenase accessory sulfurtransferase FdhD [Paracoccaceae bacterium]